jgi:hypothetical protein
MKKIKLLCLLLLLIVASLIFIKYIKPLIPTQTQQQTEDTTTLKNQLKQYQDKEREEELKKAELEKLQNPEIIKSTFRKVGKLVVLESTATYKDTIQVDGFLNTKKIYLNLTYNYGMAIDLKEIIIVRYVDDMVVLRIQQDKIALEYTELQEENTLVDSKKSFLASQFKPKEVTDILLNAQKTVREDIMSNAEVKQAAYENLKDVLTEEITKLGYSRVLFE